MEWGASGLDGMGVLSFWGLGGVAVRHALMLAIAIATERIRQSMPDSLKGEGREGFPTP